MTTLAALRNDLRDEETKLLAQLRHVRQAKRQSGGSAELNRHNLGESFADGVARIVGSWPFVIVQSLLLILWIAVNVIAFTQRWDPYPFILLNLALSFQAAYTAPIIMMSQNRQATIDREAARHDYEVNLKAELEIELLHQKVDFLRETELANLIAILHDLRQDLLATKETPLPRA